MWAGRVESLKFEHKEKAILSALFLLLLILFLYKPNPEEIPVRNLDPSKIKKYVKTKGKVTDLYKGQEITVFDLKNGKSIKVVAFRNLNVQEGDFITVVGQVRFYEKELELVLEEVK